MPQVSAQIAKLLPDGTSYASAVLLLCFGKLQIVLTGFLAMSTNFFLLPSQRSVQCINDGFRLLPRFVEQGHVGGKSDIRGGYRSLQEELPLIASTTAVSFIFVVLLFNRLKPALDLLLEMSQILQSETLSEIHHHRWIKWLLVAVIFVPEEELQVWIFLDLLYRFLIRRLQSFLDHERSQGDAGAFRGSSDLAVMKLLRVFLLYLIPWHESRHDHLRIIASKLASEWQVELLELGMSGFLSVQSCSHLHGFYGLYAISRAALPLHLYHISRLQIKLRLFQEAL